jgi:tetratricopeptide (TPR) repeat protein
MRLSRAFSEKIPKQLNKVSIMTLFRTSLILLLVFGLWALPSCQGGGGRRNAGGGQPPLTGDAQIKAVLELGRTMIVTGDYPSALSTLLRAKEYAPNNPEVYNYLGQTYFYQGNYPQAIENYNKSLALDPTKTEVRNNLGLVFMEMEDYEAAKAQFQSCVDDPTYSRAYLARYNIALLEEAQGNPHEALNLYEQIIRSNGQFTTPYYRMGLIYYGQDDYQRAVDYLTTAVRLDGNYADAFFLLGETLEKLGLKKEAAEAFGRVVVLENNSPRAMEAQTRARRAMGF